MFIVIILAFKVRIYAGFTLGFHKTYFPKKVSMKQFWH